MAFPSRLGANGCVAMSNHVGESGILMGPCHSVAQLAKSRMSARLPVAHGFPDDGRTEGRDREGRARINESAGSIRVHAP